eukprot:COSAG02_NODE_49765_length_324_cov_64.777778_1_plen_79_part_00
MARPEANPRKATSQKKSSNFQCSTYSTVVRHVCVQYYVLVVLVVLVVVVVVVVLVLVYVLKCGYRKFRTLAPMIIHGT